MVSLTSLWLPILVSAVAAFIASAVVHMVLRYHNTDFGRIPGEDDVMRSLGSQALAPGDYIFPYPHGGEAAMKDPAFVEKRTRGPAGWVRVFRPGMPGMGPLFGKWFLYQLVISIFAAYLAGRALPSGAPGGEIFRFTTTVGFLAYGMAYAGEAIWYERPWSTALKNLLDAVIYGAAMGAVFVWLWP
ncbi:MAG TPA: hypothetical protein VEB19_13565 [Gemmatimonadaceae bacterium]|nr:hypothetical protein [Gemmatimonadaceae bacterium]